MLGTETPGLEITPAPLKLCLFGAPHVILPNGHLASFEADSAMALFAYLTLHPNKAFSRTALAALLYPDQDGKQAMQNFRQALFRLRRAIHDEDAQPPYLVLLQETVEFNTASAHRIDAAEFDAGIEATHKHRHRRIDACATCIQHLTDLVELYRGDLLAELVAYDDLPLGEWLRIQREHYRELACGALHTLIAYHQARQNTDAVLQHCERLWQIDALDEVSLRAQMRELAHSGQRNRALLLYRDFETRLRGELEVAPEPESAQLAKQLRGNTLPPVPAPKQRTRTLLTAQTFSHRALPNTLMPFVNRTREMQALRARLSERDCRLVTLTGPSGIGKTRLAMRAASEDTVGWKYGVWLAMFGETKTQTPLQVIAHALGVPVTEGGSAQAELYQFLRGREMLLMLDNVECATDAAEWIRILLERAPELQIIATCLEPLGIRGEINLRVEGLAYPEENGVFFTDWRETFPSMALFAEHAARVRPDLEWNAEAILHTAHICRILQGVPLAIEAAAACVRTMRFNEIADALANHPRTLDQTRVDVPPRQSTLCSAFDYAWKRLTGAQQIQYTKLAALPAPFSIAQAEAGANLNASQLMTLCEKSMLRSTCAGNFDLYAAHRFFLPPDARTAQ